MSDDTTPKPCPFCGEPASAAERIDGLQFGCMNNDCEGALASGWMPFDAWNTRPIEDALRARAEAAEAALAEYKATSIAICGCGEGRQRLVDEDGLCVDCGCDVVVVADQHSAGIVVQLRQEREAAEAALAALASLRARAEAAEAEVKRWREPQGELDLQVYIVRQALDTLRAIVIGSAAALNGAQLRYHEAQVEVDKLRAELATARAEGAAAERADVVEWLRTGGAEALCCAGCVERGEHVAFLRDRDAYIAAATAHVRPVEGA